MQRPAIRVIAGPSTCLPLGSQSLPPALPPPLHRLAQGATLATPLRLCSCQIDDERNSFEFDRFCPTGTSPPPVLPTAVVKLHPNGNIMQCLDVRGAQYENGTSVQGRSYHCLTRFPDQLQFRLQWDTWHNVVKVRTHSSIYLSLNDL